MKKGICLVLVLMLLLLSCTVCAAEAPAYDLAGKTISIATLAGEPSLGLKTAIPSFEKLYGCTVNLVEIPSDQFSEKLLMDLSSKTGVYDCVMGMPDGWEVSPADYFENLDQYINDPAIADPALDMSDYFTANLEYMKQDGLIYGMPWKPDVTMYYYRKDLFEDEANKAAFKEKYGYELDVPATYEQYMDIGEFFYRPDEGLYGSAIMGLVVFDQLTTIFLNRAYSTNQGDIFAEDFSECYFDTDDIIMVLKSIAQEATFACPGFETLSYEQNSAAFIQGRVAQTITWPALWNDSNVKETSEFGASTVAGNVGVAPLPSWENSSRPGTTRMGGWWICIPLDSKQKVEAYKLAEYMCGKESMRLKIAEGSYPVLYSTWEELDVAEQDKVFYETYLKQLEAQKPFPLILEWADFKNIIQDDTSAVLCGLMTPEDAAKDMQEKCTALLEEYGYR